MAEDKPTGTATSIDHSTMFAVPATSGSTPNEASENDGAQRVPNRKSVTGTTRKKSTVPTSSDSTIPVVTTTDKPAHSARSARITRSPYRGREAASGR